MLLPGLRARIVANIFFLFALAIAVFLRRNFGDQNQFIHFFKNVAIAGGLLHVVAFGGGRMSLPPSRSSRRVTVREIVATDTPMALDAPANDRSSATLANIARSSKSGSFDIDNPATIAFIHFYFENASAATRSCGPQRNMEMRDVGQDS